MTNEQSFQVVSKATRNMQRALYDKLILWLVAILLISCNNVEATPRLAAHTLQATDEWLAVAHTAEFDTIVQLFAWREIEPTRGQFHWESADQVVAGAEFYDLDLIVRLDQHPAWASGVDLTLNAPPDSLG